MRGKMTSSLLLCLVAMQITTHVMGHREHRVHNIALYPGKHSWCKTEPIKQIIGHPEYKSQEIDNNVCVGACFSYSIPHTEPSDPGEVIVPYCDSCQPSETTWHHITLQREKENHEMPSNLIKRVQIIKNCTCTSCDKNRQETYSEWLLSQQDDDESDSVQLNHGDSPDFIDIISIRNESMLNKTAYNHNTDKMKHMLDHKLIHLLKKIQENNEKVDKLQLVEMLKKMELKISDSQIEEFVETLSEDNIEIDINKLKEILVQYDEHQSIEIDGEEKKSHHHHHNNVHNPHHRAHHVGDIIEGHGHLARGPHGALIIQPDTESNTIHGKLLDVYPHELKPNHAGVVHSYESHSSSKSIKDD